MLCSATALVAERVQAPSFSWVVENGIACCTVARPPFEASKRTYDPARIRRVVAAEHDSIPGGKVVRFEMSGLNFHLPAQSSQSIPSFDRYVEELDAFMARARSGDAEASLRWSSRGLRVMLVSAALAVGSWVWLFAMAGRRTP